jgi:hypothetical protein
MPFDFPTTPGGTLSELWTACLRLLPQLEQKVIRDVAIATTETPVAHGMKSAPKTANVAPHSDARWWVTRAPDSRFVYLAASAAIIADVEIVA